MLHGMLFFVILAAILVSADGQGFLDMLSGGGTICKPASVFSKQKRFPAPKLLNDIPKGGLAANGCGPEGMQVDEPFELFRCCNRHDVCYSSCGSTHTFCEQQFYSCMQAVCAAPFNRKQKEACDKKAKGFSSMTGLFGPALHTDSQRDLCDCFDDQKAAKERFSLFIQNVQSTVGENAKSIDPASILEEYYPNKTQELVFDLYVQYGDGFVEKTGRTPLDFTLDDIGKYNATNQKEDSKAVRTESAQLDQVNSVSDTLSQDIGTVNNSAEDANATILDGLLEESPDLNTVQSPDLNVVQIKNKSNSQQLEQLVGGEIAPKENTSNATNQKEDSKAVRMESTQLDQVDSVSDTLSQDVGPVNNSAEDANAIILDGLLEESPDLDTVQSPDLNVAQIKNKSNSQQLEQLVGGEIAPKENTSMLLASNATKDPPLATNTGSQYAQQSEESADPHKSLDLASNSLNFQIGETSDLSFPGNAPLGAEDTRNGPPATNNPLEYAETHDNKQTREELGEKLSHSVVEDVPLIATVASSGGKHMPGNQDQDTKQNDKELGDLPFVEDVPSIVTENKQVSSAAKETSLPRQEIGNAGNAARQFKFSVKSSISEKEIVSLDSKKYQSNQENQPKKNQESSPGTTRRFRAWLKNEGEEIDETKNLTNKAWVGFFLLFIVLIVARSLAKKAIVKYYESKSHINRTMRAVYESSSQVNRSPMNAFDYTPANTFHNRVSKHVVMPSSSSSPQQRRKNKDFVLHRKRKDGKQK